MLCICTVKLATNHLYKNQVYITLYFHFIILACVYIGSRLSETNLDNEDYNDDYLTDNQTESDTESICEEVKEHWDVSTDEILRDFNEESFSELNNPKVFKSVQPKVLTGLVKKGA